MRSLSSGTRNALAGLIALILIAGIGLAITRPGTLGDDIAAPAATTTTTTTLPPITTTTAPVDDGIDGGTDGDSTTTTIPSGLGAPGAGRPTNDLADTGASSLLGGGLALLAIALAAQRSARPRRR